MRKGVWFTPLTSTSPNEEGDLSDTWGCLRMQMTWHSSKHYCIHTKCACLKPTWRQIEEVRPCPILCICTSARFSATGLQNWSGPYAPPQHLQKAITKTELYKQEICNLSHLSRHSSPVLLPKDSTVPSTTFLLLHEHRGRRLLQGWDLKATSKLVRSRISREHPGLQAHL